MFSPAGVCHEPKRRMMFGCTSWRSAATSDTTSSMLCRRASDELVVVGLIRLSAHFVSVNECCTSATEPLAPAPSVRMSLKLARKAWASA